jgi:hypothetical protein
MHSKQNGEHLCSPFGCCWRENHLSEDVLRAAATPDALADEIPAEHAALAALPPDVVAAVDAAVPDAELVRDALQAVAPVAASPPDAGPVTVALPAAAVALAPPDAAAPEQQDAL